MNNMVKKIKKVSARRCGSVLTDSGYAISADIAIFRTVPTIVTMMVTP